VGVGNECGPYSQCVDCLCVSNSYCGDGVIQWKHGEQCEIPPLDRCGPGKECVDCRCVRVE
jgi:hypothetical protein